MRQPTRDDGISSSHKLIEDTVPEAQLRQASRRPRVAGKRVSTLSHRAYALTSGRHGEDCTHCGRR